MNTRSRSTLFLIEQLIVVAVFSLCAAACIRILTDAYFTANNNRDIGNALLVAESGAESYKATAGDIGKVAAMMGGISGNVDGSPAVVVYYDKQWQICGEDLASYRLCLISEPSASLHTGEISVEKITGEELIAFTVVAQGTGEELIAFTVVAQG